MLDDVYTHVPVPFVSGEMTNGLGQNAGSGKLLSFAIMSGLGEEETATLWGENYRDVVNTPEKQDHGNIRNLLKFGFKGVHFPEGLALREK